MNDENSKHLLWRIERNCKNIEKQLVWNHRHSVLFYILILSFGISLITPFSFLCLAVSLNSLKTVYSKRQVILSEQELEDDSSEEFEELEDIALESDESEEQTKELKEQKDPKDQIERLRKATPSSTSKTHTKEDPNPDRVEAYQLIGCGYRLIISSGPKNHRTYRAMPGKEYKSAWDIKNVPRIAPYEGRRETPIIVGVAFQDFGMGYSVLDPKLYTSPRRGKNMPVTYVKVSWGDCGDSWETRSDVRTLLGGRARADAVIFEKVKKFEEDAVAYKRKNPGWNKKVESKVKVGSVGS